MKPFLNKNDFQGPVLHGRHFGELCVRGPCPRIWFPTDFAKPRGEWSQMSQAPSHPVLLWEFFLIMKMFMTRIYYVFSKYFSCDHKTYFLPRSLIWVWWVWSRVFHPQFHVCMLLSVTFSWGAHWEQFILFLWERSFKGPLPTEKNMVLSPRLLKLQFERRTWAPREIGVETTDDSTPPVTTPEKQAQHCLADSGSASSVHETAQEA